MKTTMLTHLAGCVSTKGKDFFGHETAHGAVLYIASEDKKTVVKRLNAWAQRYGKAADDYPVWVMGQVLLNNEQDARKLHATIRKAKQQALDAGYELKLVLVDTLARSIKGSDSDEETMSEVMGLLEGTAEEFDLAVIYAHHTGHSEQHRGRGSSVKDAAAHFSIILAADEDKYGRITHMRFKYHRNMDVLPWHIFRVESVPYGWRVTPNTKVQKRCYQPVLIELASVEEKLLIADAERKTKGRSAKKEPKEKKLTDFIRDLHEAGVPWDDMADKVMEKRPDENPDSVARTVRAIRKEMEEEDEE